ncbi:hypothetical protein BJF95_08995 [Rhizobium oryziradicis]|uniref:Uncharacterized protein n=1 Tax=Rhizobium oryziradicis TaxID=1867956 RepID=A0A1Q8ZRE3_9HYPH|nr:hypothetical protein BJF95_08995 [Rhizobium oryziradicis]
MPAPGQTPYNPVRDAQASQAGVRDWKNRKANRIIAKPPQAWRMDDRHPLAMKRLAASYRIAILLPERVASPQYPNHF